MRTTTKWLSVAAIAVLALVVTTGSAQAQYWGYGPRSPYAAAAYQRAYYAAAINQAYAWSYYGNYGNPSGYGYWGYSPYQDPYGSYLRGGADVISAQSRYLVAIQEANLLREQVKARQIENRRSAFDHYLYVRERTPTIEQLRAEDRNRRRDRAQTDPPVTEVYSATALNDLLADLQQIPLAGVTDVPLDTETVRRVNFTPSRNGANIGLFRNAAKLTWPGVLQGEEYQPARERLTSLAQGALERLQAGKAVDSATLLQMYDDLEVMHQKLRDSVTDLTAPQYIEAKRFLNLFGDALKALQHADAANYFNGRFEFQGKSVAELVKFMTERGLWFAPAVSGDEPAYTAVHRALANFSLAAHTAVLQTGVTKK
jgi:hypothetical protein